MTKSIRNGLGNRNVIINPYRYKDPYWSNVVLLIQPAGPDASTTITDLSNSAHTITANGGVQQDTAQTKYSAASVLFDGNGDYLNLDGSSDFAYGTGDVTIECWIRFNSLPGVSASWGGHRPASTNGQYPYVDIDSFNSIRYHVNNSVRIGPSSGITTATWYHFAWCRGSGSSRLFVDGVQKGSTYSDSHDLLVGASRPIIGANDFDPSLTDRHFDGWIGAYRITKGVARYISNFTPPTGVFPTS